MDLGFVDKFHSTAVLPFVLLLLTFFHHPLTQGKKKAPKGAFSIASAHLIIATEPAARQRASFPCPCARNGQRRRSMQTACSHGPFQRSYPGGCVCRLGAPGYFPRAQPRRRKLSRLAFAPGCHAHCASCRRLFYVPSLDSLNLRFDRGNFQRSLILPVATLAAVAFATFFLEDDDLSGAALIDDFAGNFPIGH